VCDFELVVIVFFYLLLFQHVKCTFDSSASVNMMMTMNAYITITTVMTTKLISRSHNSCFDVVCYVVTCIAIGVVIFGISLAAVSAAEMILVCLISSLWFFFCYLLLFQHVKCTFDSSASVNMMMTMNAYITITTVMTTKFISRFCLTVILGIFLILYVSFIIMMTIKICITITIFMTTNFNSRSRNSCVDVYDNNIHKVRIVFCSIRC
jgi:hypothetical protein